MSSSFSFYLLAFQNYSVELDWSGLTQEDYSLHPTASSMEQELNQLVQAILIASDPTSGNLHQQALEYLTSVQQNSQNTWRLALSLFVDCSPDGSRKYLPQVRFFALRVLDEFFDNR